MDGIDDFEVACHALRCVEGEFGEVIEKSTAYCVDVDLSTCCCERIVGLQN